MPITCTVDETNAILRMSLSGTLTEAEMTGAIDDAVRDIKGQSCYDVLSDHRAIVTPATPQQIRAVVSHISSHTPTFSHARWAIVVTGAAQVGMMQMLRAFAVLIPIEVRLFTDPADAEAWLAEDHAPRREPSREA